MLNYILLRLTEVTQRLRHFIVISALLTGLISATPAFCQGNLILYPRRIIFEGAKHIQEINLANTGKDTATYQISVLEMRMKEDGNFEEVIKPDSAQLFAEPYIRIFPRKVSLGPNETQVVKVQLSGNTKMNPGEYRSHLYFRAVQNLKPKGSEPEAAESRGISVRITPVFGISIPVLIRVGEQKTSVSISGTTISDITDSSAIVSLTLNRTGTSSMYGNLILEYDKENGHPIRLAEADGVAVYTPNKLRHIRIQVLKKKGIAFRSGVISIRYESSGDMKTVRYADALLNLGSH